MGGCLPNLYSNSSVRRTEEKNYGKPVSEFPTIPMVSRHCGGGGRELPSPSPSFSPSSPSSLSRFSFILAYEAPIKRNKSERRL